MKSLLQGQFYKDWEAVSLAEIEMLPIQAYAIRSASDGRRCKTLGKSGAPMELIMLILLLGPLLARILCSTRLDSSSALGLAISNIIIVGIWAAIFSALDRVAAHWLAMILGWVILIGIQGVFFGMAMRGTKCAEFTSGLFKEVFQSRK